LADGNGVDYVVFSISERDNLNASSGETASVILSDRVEFYEYDGNSWTQKGPTIGGKRFFAVDTISDLKSLTPTPNTVAVVRGYHAPDGPGGGLFHWNAAADAATANGGTLIASTVSGYTDGDTNEGVWRRQYSGMVNATWFGVRGDGVTDETANMQKAVDFCEGTSGPKLYIPPGEYLIEQVQFGSYLTVEGAGWVTELRNNTATDDGMWTPKSNSAVQNDVVFRDLWIDMNNNGSSLQNNGIALQGVDGFEVRRVKVTNSINYGIWMHSGKDSFNTVTKNGRVVGCLVKDCKENIEAKGGEDIVIRDNVTTANDPDRTNNHIYVWNGCRRIKIAGNICVGPGSGIAALGGTQSNGRVSFDIDVISNYVRCSNSNVGDGNDRAIYFIKTDDVRIFGGFYQHDDDFAFLNNDGTKFHIANVNFRGKTYAMDLSVPDPAGEEDMLIRDCKIVATGGASTIRRGIRAREVDRLRVEGCIIGVTDNVTISNTQGLELEDCVDVVVSDCDIRGNYHEGVWLKNCDRTVIKGLRTALDETEGYNGASVEYRGGNNPPNNQCRHILSGCHFDSRIGVKVADQKEVQIDNCSMYATQFGVDFAGKTADCSITNCFISMQTSDGNLAVYGIDQSGESYNDVPHLRIRNVIIEGSGGASASRALRLIGTGSGVLISECTFRPDASWSKIYVTPNQIRIFGNRFENDLGLDVAGNNCTVTGNQFPGTAGLTDNGTGTIKANNYNP